MRIATLAIALTAGLLLASPGQAQITWYWDGPPRTPQAILDQITASMNEAVDHYNAYSVYDWQDYSNDPRGIRVIYDPAVPTANAGFRSRISFGNSRGVSTAMHEMGHVFGVGTAGAWNSLRTITNQWTGLAANTEYRRYEGPNAIVNAGAIHFWNYGLNFSTEDSPEARFRHVRMVGALREDMGLFNGNATELLGDYNNDGVTDAADYTIYRDRLGEDTSLVNDRSVGSVSEVDYGWWRRGYGTSLATSTAVPEPSGVGLGLMGIVALAHRPRRR